VAGFLKVISAIYLILLWAFIAIAIAAGADNTLPSAGKAGATLLITVIGVLSSIPAVALYAFGQVVEDIRSARNHLHAMRRYYEPQAPLVDLR
jgi:hypothetical protein